MNVAENINKSCIIAFLLQNICINPLNVFRWKWEGFLIQGTLKWMIWHDGSCCFIHLIHLYNFIIMIYDITKTWIEEIWNVAFGVTKRKSPLWSRWYVIEWLFALSLSLSPLSAFLARQELLFLIILHLYLTQCFLSMKPLSSLYILSQYNDITFSCH